MSPLQQEGAIVKVELRPRRQGKTTAGILEKISRALLDPGKAYYFRDHAVDEYPNLIDGEVYRTHLLKTAEDIVHKLGLQVEVELLVTNAHHLRFTSTKKQLFYGSDNHLYERVL